MLDSWQKGVAITLKANPDYWGEKPKIQKIVYRTIADDMTRVAELQAGSADVVADLSPSLAPLVEALPDAEVKRIPSQRRVFFFLSAKHKPTDDVKVRQAVAHAIDRNAIVSSLLAQDAVPLKGVYLPGEIGYEASFEGIRYDPEKAKALLAEAGFPNGVTIDLHFTQDGSVMEPYVAQAVQAQLAAVGITANLDGAAQSIMIQKYGAGDSTGMSLANYAPMYADSSFLVSRAYFASKSRYGGYLDADDKQLDEVGAAANLTTDAAFRQKTYAEIEKHVIVDQAYWVPLYQLVDSYGVSKKIDWDPRPDQNFDFGTALVR
jgi:peptide/nickel transport system substrate-binding protein